MIPAALQSLLQPDLQRVEGFIRHALSTDVQLLSAINASLREHPGKMMRPMLGLLTARALGGVTEDTLRISAVVELLHNASLLHDDVVDGASERRGLPTLASQMGGGPAVLIGDFWLVRSIPLILEVQHGRNRVLSISAGVLSSLAEGELLQMEKASSGDTREDDYLRIIRCKTAALFEAVCEMAALSVKAIEPLIQRATAFGRQIGMVFQMKDDIFDYQDASAALGKPVGIDLKEQKITLPLLCALEGCSEPEAKAVRTKMTRIAEEPELAGEIRSFVVERGGVALAEKRVQRELQRALDLLEGFPPSQEKDWLALVARHVAERNM